MRFEGKFRIINTYIVICFRQNMLILFTAAMLMKLVIKGGRISVLASLIHLVLFIFLFIYRIRIFLQTRHLYG